MSAIRVPGPTGAQLLDPYTHEPYVPDLSTRDMVGPVTVRKATPEELARFERPKPARTEIRFPVRVVDDVRSPRRHPMAHVSDVAVCEALRATSGNVSAAADRLGVSIATMHRRTTAMREGGRMPDDIPDARSAMYAARRARGTCR